MIFFSISGTVEATTTTKMPNPSSNMMTNKEEGINQTDELTNDMNSDPLICLSTQSKFHVQNSISIENVTVQNVTKENVTIQNVARENISFQNVTSENITFQNDATENVTFQNDATENVAMHNVNTEIVTPNKVSEEESPSTKFCSAVPIKAEYIETYDHNLEEVSKLVETL